MEVQTITDVLLVRHGQARSNVTGFYMGRSDEDMDDIGYGQVRKLSSRLAGMPVTSVYTSPLQRTYMTATIVTGPHNIGLQVLDDLTEIQLGDWHGLHRDEIIRRWPELWQQWRIDPSGFTMPNGESFGEVTERAVRAFKTVVASNKGGQVVMVTHDIIIRVLVAHVLGVTNSIYRRLEVNNATISVVRVIDGKAMLIKLNDTSHLEDRYVVP